MAFGVATVITNVGKWARCQYCQRHAQCSWSPHVVIGTGATSAARTAAAADTALSPRWRRAPPERAAR